MFLLLTGNAALIIPTALAMTRTSFEELVNDVGARAPILTPFLTYPGIFGAPYSSLFIEYLERMFMASIVICVIGLVLSYCFYLVLKSRKPLLTQETYDLHVMLFNSLLLQVLSGIFLTAIPICLFALVTANQYPYGSYITMICMCVPTLHDLVINLGFYYFVKSYRRFIIDGVKKTWIKIKRKVTGKIDTQGNNNDQGNGQEFTVFGMRYSEFVRRNNFVEK